MLMFPVSNMPQLSKGKATRYQHSIGRSHAWRGSPGATVVLPPQSALTIHVGKRKIKLRPEELQKVTGERGRRGTLMRGLRRLIVLRSTLLAVPAAVIAKSNMPGRALFPPACKERRMKR
ncbi:hypothetical protein ACNKHM_17330 [Shigella sonnei]